MALRRGRFAGPSVAFRDIFHVRVQAGAAGRRTVGEGDRAGRLETVTPSARPRGPIAMIVAAVACLAIAGVALAVTKPNAAPSTRVAARGSAHSKSSNASNRPGSTTHPRRRIAKATTTTAATLAPPSTAPPPSTAAPTTAAPATTATTSGVVSSTGLGSVAGKTIAIDPGHNGQNYAHPEINQLVNIGTMQRACDTTGTATTGGYTESAFNLDVSLRVASILRGAGANVVLTRSTNDGWGPCITERAAIGNRAHAAVAISIHADGGPTDGHGFHVLYPPSIAGLTEAIAANSLRLANDVRAAYHDGTGMPYSTYAGGGTALMARTDLGGLNLSTVPKVFIETGNMRSAGDAAMLTDPGFRQRAAVAIANGLARYLAGQ
ncbi:MAG: N-acetylmuramoyl-L-alanine amidase [Actinomycetia bacterium]|nr:N-acetylmuramoyl-L-alanine amidase [Actinomycetes bacterium]